MCTDYRKVNSVTVPDSFPLPRIEDIIDDIGGAKYVSKLDLLKGYYQVKLTEEAKRISAFVTPNGLFQYTVMPFGMRNAPASFQRLMTLVTSGLEGVRVYLDDLVIYSITWEQHMERLRRLLTAMADAKLTINLLKSEWGHAKITFLGHVVGAGDVSTIPAKVEAIKNFPVRRTRKEVMRFLGMGGYYRKFCPNISTVASPLTNLVSPRTRFQWTPECQTAFDKIRSLLTSAPVLRAPNFKKQFVFLY